MFQSFIVPGPLPGANEVMGKGSRWAYTAMKKKWHGIIVACIQQAKIKPVRMASLEYHWYERNTRRDKDNIMFAQKFVQDSLVIARTLKDDGWEEIGTVTHTFQVDKDEPRLIVVLIGD